MATSIQVTFDCADPARLARFWAETLHYIEQPPPDGFASWDEALAALGIENTGQASAIVDPDGAGPRIYFQRVPEAKVTKNRVHLDVNAGAGHEEDERKRIVDAEVRRLVALGAAILRPGDFEDGEHWVVMADPEGNEFCVQ